MKFLEQAARAERLARYVMDAYATQALMGYARECRAMAARPVDLTASLPDEGVRYCLVERQGAPTGYVIWAGRPMERS
jgi:hypothetical protein